MIKLLLQLSSLDTILILLTTLFYKCNDNFIGRVNVCALPSMRFLNFILYTLFSCTLMHCSTRELTLCIIYHFEFASFALGVITQYKSQVQNISSLLLGQRYVMIFYEYEFIE